MIQQDSIDWNVNIDERVRIETIAVVMKIAISPSGHQISIGDLTGWITIWDPVSRKDVWQYRAHAHHITQLIYHSDQYLISGGCQEGVIRVWDTMNLAQAGYDLKGHNSRSSIYTIIVSQNGNYLISNGDDSIRVWNFRTQQEIQSKRIKIHQTAFRWDANPLGQQIAYLKNQKIRLWDFKRNKTIGILRENDDFILSLKFSSKGTRIVTATQQWIKIWNLENKQQLQQIPIEVGYFSFLRLEPRQIIQIGDNKQISFWDLETFEQIGKTLKQHSSLLSAAPMTTDGKYIVLQFFNKNYFEIIRSLI